MNENDMKDFLQSKKKVLLGHGSFGEVYKWTNNANEQVAIKVIEIRDVDEFKNLKKEINILKQIKSPNTVKLLENFDQGNIYYLVMEYCDGGDLKQLLDTKKSLPENQVKQLMADFLNGYLQLLINYIIHRDLKPANILIHQNRYKIADFGYSRHLEISLDQMLHSISGTPFYSSPQIKGISQYSNKSDVWSFGIILYQCLYGGLPFSDNTQNYFFDLIRNGQFQLPNSVAVSQQLKNLILKCLAIEECDRISWQQLMKDPYVLEFFQEYIKLEKDIQQQEQLLIEKLIQMYTQNNKLDINLILQKYKKNGELNFEGFSSLIDEVNPDLQKYYREHIYNSISNQKTKVVSKEELRNWLYQDLNGNTQNLQHQLSNSLMDSERVNIGDHFYFDTQENLISEKDGIAIYRGRTNRTNVDVAIKIIPNEKIPQSKADIEILKRLKSPHIVKIIDLIEDQSNTYLISEYCEGGDLQKLLDIKKQITEREVKVIFAGLLDALFELYKNGIAYRQLDFSHILLKYNQIKLINNFHNVREVQHSQSMLETVSFDLQIQNLSQQAKDDEPNYSAFQNDIYALGAVILQCIWKDSPLSEDKFNSPQLTKFPDYISKELQSILQKCLEKDQIKRITIQELLREPYITQFYDKYLPLEKDIIKKEKQIIKAIKESKTVLQELSDQIDLNLFSSIIRESYKQEMLNFEIEYIYYKINILKEQTIDRNQLLNWINEQIDEIPTVITKLLIPAMKKHKVDVRVLFNKFQEKSLEKKPLGYMVFERFKEIILNFRKSVKDPLIQQAFNYFVKNEQNKIIEKDFIAIIQELY